MDCCADKSIVWDACHGRRCSVVGIGITICFYIFELGATLHPGHLGNMRIIRENQCLKIDEPAEDIGGNHIQSIMGGGYGIFSYPSLGAVISRDDALGVAALPENPPLRYVGVHIDLRRVASASQVEVVHRHCTCRGAVEGDGFDKVGVVGSPVRFFGVVEVKGIPACAPVQVALACYEVTPASVRHRNIVAGRGDHYPLLVENSAEHQSSLVVKAATIEVSDERGIRVGVAVRLVEQVDVVAADACIEVLVDEGPALVFVLGFQGVRFSLRSADDHHIGDEVVGLRIIDHREEDGEDK